MRAGLYDIARIAVGLGSAGQAVERVVGVLVDAVEGEVAGGVVMSMDLSKNATRQKRRSVGKLRLATATRCEVPGVVRRCGVVRVDQTRLDQLVNVGQA